MKLNLTNNELMIICVYYGKQESRSKQKKKDQKTNLIKYQHT